MFQECRHILPGGHKCKAAALKGQAFCYYHTGARRYASITTTSAGPLLFPSVEDAAGIQIALNLVLRELGARRLNPRDARVYFYGLQIAARLARKSNPKPTETVREFQEDPEEGNLALEKIVCEPPADCINCRRRAFCPNFEDWEDEVEELEQCLEAEREANETAEEEQDSDA